MRKFIGNVGPILIMVGISGALAPPDHAQVSSLTKVRTSPENLYFSVDGTTFIGTMSAMWTSGTNHVLSVDQVVQKYVAPRTRYTFANWSANGTGLQGSSISITASPKITDYVAQFSTEYAINFHSPCQTNGSILINGSTVVSSDQEDVYFPAGSTVTLTPVPNPGYAFAGWQAGANQSISGQVNTVTMNAPVIVIPAFTPASSVSIVTSPPELRLLIDRATVYSPSR